MVVQINSVELMNRIAAVPDRACTARLDRIRNIDMCTQNTPQMGIRVKSVIYHLYSGGGDHRSTTDSATTHGPAIMLIVLLAASRDTVFAQTEMRVFRVW